MSVPSTNPDDDDRDGHDEQQPAVVAVLGETGGRVGVVPAGDVRRLEALRARPDRAWRVVRDRVGREGDGCGWARRLGLGRRRGLGLGHRAIMPPNSGPRIVISSGCGR